ncbi:MAG: dihydrodipicolinate reductase [halophilic archaeon J07HX64]|jgi:dihydrodipicolinate reductase (EC 1.3.1.26)|nr:MAG: dihydrodipicolinate reductase [halophilic archaeon J07HX64]
MTTIGVQGVTGRTGRTVVETATDREDVTVAFGISQTDPDTDTPTYDPDERAAALDTHTPDAVIDFSEPAAAVSLAGVCADADVPLVVGTTGFDDDQFAALRRVSKRTPVLKATNFARGVQALLAALGPALESLPGYDVELLETHHNGKRDAPSGTASTLLDRIAEYREFETVPGREGIQPRDSNEVGVLVRRAGDVRGEHEVLLAGNNELLTLTHRAEDRGVFGAGALDAATWLVGRDPGWYSFEDVVTTDRP